MERLIYVVDPNAEVRLLIQEFLTRCDTAWEVRTFEQPAAALAACREQSPDALLLDLTGPDAVGSDWMEVLRLASPLAMRIIMAVEPDARLNPRLSSAHQYLCKPFVFSELYYKMRRGFDAQSRFQNEQVKLRILSLRSIPSLPKTYYAVVTAMQEPSSNLGRVADVLAQDSGLTTTLLRLANSPLFGTHVVSDLLEAVMVLGTERLKAILVSHELLQRYSSLKGPLQVQAVWDHSYHTAILAKRFCEKAKLEAQDGDTAFLGGLLHNTGRFVLMDNFESDYAKAAVPEGNDSLSTREKRILRVSGEEVSGFLLDMWGMTEGVVHAASFHERPWDQPDATDFTPTTAVYLANHFTHTLQPPYPDRLPRLDEAYLKRVSPPDLGSIEDLTAEAKACDFKQSLSYGV